jgi:hypothetical protein
MSGPGLIAGYLDALSRQLPSHVVEELADGLEETYRRHLGLGLAPETAARAAAAEFGDPDLIAAEFTRVHPARRAARRLLAAGPAVGLCWAVALVTGRAWTWPVPMVAGLVPGVVLMAVVAVLAFAARSTRYRSIGRAGVAGCIGTAALDAFMIIGVLAADPAARWAVAMAIAASAARLVLNVSLVRSALTASGLHDRAAPFDEDDVAPAAVVPADALAGADGAEPGGPVQGQAGGVLREDPGLDGPDPGGLGGGDQRIQEPAAGAPVAGGGVDVDGVLDHSGVDAAAGDGRGGYPPGDLSAGGSDEPVSGQPGRSEGRPVRHRGFEGGVALLDPSLVDREHGASMRAGHRLDARSCGGDRRGQGLTARMIAECTPSPT